MHFKLTKFVNLFDLLHSYSVNINFNQNDLNNSLKLSFELVELKVCNKCLKFKMNQTKHFLEANQLGFQMRRVVTTTKS